MTGIVVCICLVPRVAEARAADADQDRTGWARPPLEEVQVTATRRSVRTTDAAGAIGVVRMEAAMESTPSIVAEALRGHAGTFFQQTTPGQGIPIIRGLKGSQVLHLVDGMRLNNAFFRDAPNQYLALVDPLALDSVEVLRGAAGSLYGADAMGGVVQLLSPEFRFEQGEQRRSRFFGAWNSADAGRIARAETLVQGRDAAFAGGVSWQDYANRRVGGGDTVPHSAWSSRAADLRVAWRQGDDADWLFTAQWLEQPSTPRTDELVPGYGQDTPPSEVYLFQPNARGFLHARYRHATDLAWLGNIEVHLARQVVTDDRVTQDDGATIRNTEDNDSTLDGMTVQFVSDPADDWTLAWGLELYRDTVRSARRATELETGASLEVRARFPDRSTMDADALYATLGWRPTTRLEIDAGLRYSAFDIVLPEVADTPAVTLTPDDVTGDLRLLLDLDAGWRAVANLSRGFRPPNVFDLGTLGPRPGNRFNVANPDLGPETVWSYDAGLKFAGAHVQAELFAFYLDYRDRITSIPTGAFTPGGRVIVRAENRARVSLHGVEGGLRWLPSETLDVYAVLNWTRGDEHNESEPDTPADRIPPLNGRLGLVWRTGPGFEVAPDILFAARQDRLSLRDVSDPRINPAGTPGWWTLNLRLHWRLDDRYRLGLRLDNIRDENYREHGSGIDARGRNLGLWLDARF